MRGCGHAEVHHLLPDGGVPGPPLVLHGLLVHPHLCAPLESAAPALVAVGLVYHTPLTLPALAAVLPAPSDGSLEEAGAAVTREDAVMLPGGEVSTHLARDIVQNAATGITHILRGAVTVLHKTVGHIHTERIQFIRVLLMSETGVYWLRGVCRAKLGRLKQWRVTTGDLYQDWHWRQPPGPALIGHPQSLTCPVLAALTAKGRNVQSRTS